MKILITGVSGMVGRGVLYECLEDPRISEVVMVNRSPVNEQHPKLTEVILKDFTKAEELGDSLHGDACFFCAGVSSAGMSEEQFHTLTYDLTISFAEAVHRQNPSTTFCYVSGAGTDSTEKGKIMWARVKGKTENKLISMFPKAHMFRPGYIQPMKGVKSRTKLYAALYLIFKPLYWLIFQHFSGAATTSVNMGKAMIKATQSEDAPTILDNRTINQWASE